MAYSYCPYCGIKLPERAKFCPQCGRVIVDESEIEEKALKQNEQTNQPVRDTLSTEVETKTEVTSDGVQDEESEQLNETNISAANDPAKQKNAANKKKIKLTLFALFVLLVLVIIIKAAVGNIGKDSSTAIIESIQDGTVTISLYAASYEWEDKTGELKYGPCTVEYKYRKNDPYNLTITTVTQDPDEAKNAGDIREVKFYTKLSGKQQTGKNITADDFYVEVSYWGTNRTSMDEADSLSIKGQSDSNKYILTESNKVYPVYLTWEGYNGMVEVETDITYEEGEIYKSKCIYFPDKYYEDDRAEVTQVFSNGDFVCNSDVYCINLTSKTVHEGYRIDIKYHTIGTKFMTTVLGAEKEFGVVEIMEIVD